MSALMNSTSLLGMWMPRLYSFIISSNIISDASSCCQFLSLCKNPAFLSLVVSGNATCQKKHGSQRARNISAIPHVAPRTMTQVMAKASQLDTLNVTISNAQLWLSILEVLDHLASQVRDSWLRFRRIYPSFGDVFSPRLCSKRLCDAPGQT